VATELAFDILADDRASANISKVGRSMKSMSADVELANVRMEKATKAANAAVEKYGKDSLQAREAVAKLAKAEDAAEGAAKKLGAAQKRAAEETEAVGEATEQAAGKLDSFKTAAGAAGAGAAAAIGKGFLDNLSIEAGKAKLTAQLGLTTEESGRAGQLAGSVYRDNFGESMESVNEALRVVWSSMRAIGQDSPAQIESTTKAALTLSDTFGVDVSESVRAATRLIQTGLVGNSQEAFDLMAKGFQTGAGQADDLLETLTEYSVQFRKLGLTGSDAMSLISQGLQAGARDTDYIGDAIKEFSIRAVDGSRTTVDGFESIGLSARDTAAAFGQGGESARTAFGQVLDGIRGISDPLEQERVGVELFGTKWEDLGPQVASSLSLADNAIGNTTGTIDQMTASLGDTGAARLETWKRGLEGMVQSAAGAPGALGAAAAAMATIGPSALSSAGDIGMMVTGFQALNIHGEKAKGVLKGVAATAGALAALQVAAAAFGSSASAGIDTATKNLQEFAESGEAGSGVLAELEYDIGGLDSSNLSKAGNALAGMIEGVTGMGNVMDRSLTHAQQRIGAMDAALAAQVSAGNADQAAAQFAALTAEAERQNVTIEDLRKGFPQYQNALDGAAQANVSAGQAADKTAGSVKAEADATKELTAALDANQNELLQLSGGEVGYFAAVDATTKALRENGKGLEATTEKGRANRTALDGQAKAALSYLGVMQEQGAPASRFNAQLDQSRKRLYDAAIAFGVSKSEALGYVDAILGIPRQVDTRVTASTGQAKADVSTYRGVLWSVPTGVGTVLRANTAGAMRAVRDYELQLNRIDGRVVRAYVRTDSIGSVQGARGIGTARAGGGILPGPPSSKDNMIIAAATGEFVVNAAATSRHRDALEAINSGRVRGFAAGGFVGVSASTSRQPVAVSLNVHAPIGSQAQLEDWLQRAVDNLQRKGRL